MQTKDKNENRVLYREPLEICVEQWFELINDNSIFKEEDISLITALYHCDNSREKASKLAIILEVYSHSVLNLQIGRLGKRIIKKYPKIKYPTREDGTVRYWHIPFWGEDAEKKGQFYWQLRPELKEAVKKLLGNNDRISIELEENVFIPQELSDKETKDLFEGAKKQITVNVYERNATARKQCIEKFGYKCCVCDFDFEQFYGDIGKQFIEVHHLIPLSEINREYKVDGEKDLRPICPNCHAMVHRANLSIEELRKIVKARNYFK